MVYYNTNMLNTTMKISKENHDKLAKRAKFGESLNDVLTRLLTNFDRKDTKQKESNS